MTPNFKDIESLLKSTETLVKHQREIDLLKGESFNIFSVLKMESKENSTHSAFLGELLNPKGSHFLGTKFLELFLNQFGLTDHINIPTAEVKLEKSVGARNNRDKTGGRVDIYIWDNQGQTICIENKIYAVDQFAQIQRYVNHNNSNNNKIVDGAPVKTNEVFYLTLNGTDPSDDSKGNLLEGKDYVNISYKDDIAEWLKSCIKEAVEIPILRETIKQYIILIKKLTNTMSDEKQDELIGLILSNYKAAEFVAQNFAKAKEKITEEIRAKVFESLKTIYASEFELKLGGATSKRFSQIWFKPINTKGKTLQFGVESFSGRGHRNGSLFVGIFSSGLDVDDFVEENGFSKDGWWVNILELENFEGFELKLADGDLLKKVFESNDFKTSLIEHIVTQCENYINENKEVLRGVKTLIKVK